MQEFRRSFTSSLLNRKRYEDIDDARLISLEHRTRQLDAFLTEYRDLQLELIEMRKACDSLKQANLKTDMEDLKSALFIQSSDDAESNFANVQRHKSLGPEDAIACRPPNTVAMRPILKNSLRVSSYNYYQNNHSSPQVF